MSFTKWILSLLMAFSLFAFVACDDGAEEVGEGIDNAVEEAGDAVEDAVD